MDNRVFIKSDTTETLSLIDNGNRFVMIENSSMYGLLTRYIHPNHQGSCTLETDDNGDIITYEEYHPFGTTSYQATNSTITAAAKRYRYTGMERDDETGLSYHNARYYIPWLGRWLNCDPIGIRDGVNVYAYCGNNPITNTDKEGTQIDKQVVQENQNQAPPIQENTGWPKFSEASSPYQKIVPDGKIDSTIYINTGGANFAPEEFQKGGGLETFEKELRRHLDINRFDFVNIKFVKNIDDLKISPTDQIVNLKYDQWTSNERGDTTSFKQEPYTSSYTSNVNIAAFTLPAEYRGFASVENYKVISAPRELANTTAHEVFHGFATRATAFYGITEQNLGATDIKGHFDKTPNILNSGDQGARNGALTLDDPINKNKTLPVEKLPRNVNTIIKSWMNKENAFISPPLIPFNRVIK